MSEGKKLHQKGRVSKGVVFIKYFELEIPYLMHGSEKTLRELIAIEYSPVIFYINKAQSQGSFSCSIQEGFHLLG